MSINQYEMCNLLENAVTMIPNEYAKVEKLQVKGYNEIISFHNKDISCDLDFPHNRQVKTF